MPLPLRTIQEIAFSARLSTVYAIGCMPCSNVESERGWAAVQAWLRVNVPPEVCQLERVLPLTGCTPEDVLATVPEELFHIKFNRNMAKLFLRDFAAPDLAQMTSSLVLCSIDLPPWLPNGRRVDQMLDRAA